MSFEKEFQIPHESGDFWSSMTIGKPIPDKNRIGHGEGSQATMRSGIEFAGVGDRIPGRSMMMGNGSGCNVGSWNTATKSTSFQRNGTGQSDDFWVPVTSKKHCDTNTTSTTLQRNGIGQSDDFWVPVTSEKRCNITTKSTTLQRNGTGQSDNFWIPVTSEKHRNTTTKSTTLQRNGTGQSDNFWIPVTSEKHINERANPVPGEMQKNRLETENWQDLLGMYTDLLQEKTVDTNGILEDINRQPPPVVHNNGYPPPVVHNNGYPNWVASNRNLNHVAHQNHTANQATSYNTPVTSMLRSQQSQRFASNNLISNAHNTQDGFPVNYNPHYSPSSPPRFKPDAAASSVTDSFTFAPITPDNQRKYMDGQRLEEKVNFSGEETSTRAENLYNELLQTIENSPPSAVSSTQKDDIVSEDKDEQDNDLEKTPNQKTPTRRKKHRPKVIREGKLKRTPKDPKNSTSGEIRVKRKYVRRKGVNNSNENTPVETVQKRKYVRKKGVNSSNENSPAETVQKRKYVRKKGVDHSECQQQNTTVDTPPKSCKKQLIFDSESVTQDEGHESKSSLQDINVLNTPPVKTRYHDLNVLARNMATSPIQDRWENGYVNKVNELVQGNENKNVIIQANMRPMNMQCINRSFTSECMMNFDEKRGIKRQSIEEMSHNENAMNSLLWYQKMLLGAANRAYNCNQLNSTFLENHKKMKMQTEFQDNSRQMKGMIVNRSSTELLNSCTVRIDPVYKNVRIDPAYKNIMNVGGYGGNHHFRRPMAATHYLLKRQLLNGMHPHMMRLIQERSQRYTQGAMIGWNPNRASRFAVTTYPKVEPNLYNRRLNGLNEKLQQLRNNSLKSYHQSLSKARGRPRKQKAEDPVDIITHKLERLYISDSNKKHQNELVLYRGGDAIVPFEPIKKRNRNQRPKVDLDPESERLWNLLMGIDESNGAEKKDDDKEKWWENERRVFRGRTDSFIARMHLVQGDRRFSRWKGSVVDSVIGVFLTQNVSDHLSSSAFMSLAAKFPPKSTTANKTCCQDDIINSPPNSSENVTRHSSPTRGAENKHSAISEEEVILSQDSVDSSTIQTVNEYGSSSGSNSEADDLRTGIETSKQSATPQKEKPTMLKEHSCNDNLATNMNHPQKNPACNIQISRMNGTDLNSSSSQFQMSKTPSLLSSNSVVTEACHTTNVTNPQYEKPKFQTPSQGHPSQILNTNQHATEFFNETRHGAPKKVSTMFGGIPVISVEDSISVVNKQASFEDTVSEANSREQNASCAPISGPGSNMPRTKKETPEDERNRTIDWDSLRKEALSKSEKKERSEDARDTIDYEALRRANVNEISDVIKERGMNNLLADRMKDFLNRLVRDHGTVDLEWLRDAPPDKAKDYLLSFRGLGLKSVECVRLLTLHHLAFPVDTNVGRIAVRLGWVPLQPLPESLQLHLLEMYPVLESIQKYLWPRLCKLDQLTLYELHYQMITFGKVFCTKSKPNCNACPMRAECRHFASAFASARLSLPGPEEKSIVTSDAPVTAEPIPPVVISPMPLPPTENETNQSTGMSGNTCQPIIEEPTTPEPEANELSISDIEDQYYEDSDDIPTIKLNMEEFTTNLQNIMQDSNDMSKALVALNPKAASIPTPKLKDVSRLRTEHLVYELPDSHQLLEGLDKREPDDPSPYLLAIWTPGETANSVQAPTIDCSAQQSGQLCDRTTCFSCNNVREASSQVVRGTILIPCRTAMRGSFPLNGTYFQVNEMFADHASSLNPIDVPRSWIWNLPRRKVYFGTSVSTIFKGLTTEGIQYCFWKGFVCVRGFDRINRTPRPLMARLHFPASKLISQKTKANK